MFATITEHTYVDKYQAFSSPSSITKVLQCIFTQSYTQAALHIIREEIFTLVELRGIQKKCSMNDNKTKR